MDPQPQAQGKPYTYMNYNNVLSTRAHTYEFSYVYIRNEMVQQMRWESDGVLDGGAVAILVIVELGPEHDSTVLGGVVDGRKHLRLEAVHRYEAASRSIRCGRQAEEEVRGVDPCRPLVPGVDEVGGAPRRVLARRVVVELNPDIVEETCVKGFADPLVREWALRRC